MSRVAFRFLVVVMAILLATGWLTARPGPVLAVSPNIVISQIYGGGGNASATYTHDYIELFNRGNASQSLAGWSVQYASATGTGNLGGTSAQLTELPSVSLAPGQYLLIQEFSQAAVGAALPTPDVTDATPINMSGTAGKVAVVNNAASVGCNGGSAPCSAAQLAQIVDLIGYGSANFFEGAAAAATLSNTTSASRAASGCTDTDNNSTDFAAGTPAARNTSTTLNVCPSGTTLSINDVSQNEGPTGSGVMNFTVSLSAAAGVGGVTFDIATQDGSGAGGATTANNDYIAQSLTGQSITEGNSTYEFSVIVNGDETVEADESFFVNVTNLTGATISDGQGQGTLLNDDVATNPCDDAFTPIYDIQGSGAATTMPGNVVTEGVVVGDFEGTAANSGFFIQDPTGDGDATTSDGIFVFTGATDLASAGQLVRVTGFARERFNQTTINGSNSNTAPVTMVLNCGTGSVAATDVNLPFDSLTFPERYEGMSVRFPQPLVIAEYFNYGRFGEMVLALPLEGETRPFTGTAIDEPGAPALARALANSLRRITLDDNQSAQNPPALRHPNGAAFTLANKFRGGDKVQNAVGVLGFDFNLYRIFPTAGADYTAVNDRPLAPEPVGGSLTVAAMNTLNFFLTLDTTASDTGPGPCGGNQNLDCRGADANADPATDPIVDLELPRQRDKLLKALAGLDADVLGLNELENTPGVDPLGDPDVGIVAGLNEMLGEGTYAAIDTGPIGTDAIKVGLIYKPGVVKRIGDFQVLDSTDDPRFIDTRSRPALAQTFEEIATGARFTVVVNHLKSKGSACTDIGDPDAGDGQGNCNGTRTLAAQALVDWIATDPTGAGDPDFLIMGDLNSYAKEDPIDAIKAGSDDTAGTADDWTNLIEQHVGTFAYSFVFDGQSGYLDHALANASIAGQVVDADEWHINADEPSVVDYDVSFKPEAQDRLYEVNQFRTSDHDPVLVGLNLINEAPTIAVTAGNACNTSTNGGSFALVVDDNEVAAGDLTVSLTGNTNTTLVPNANVVFGGSGANRTVAITAASDGTGMALLTIGVNDGFQTTTTTIAVRVGGSADDVFVGSAGADLIVGGQGDDTLSGFGGADVLCGGQGSDTLAGGDGNDALDGGQGDDSLSGGNGNDRLVGGPGDDTLTGGADADSFSGGSGADTNTDFTPADGDTSDGT